jgi:hypothetical protein
MLKTFGKKLGKEEIQASLLWQWKNVRTGTNAIDVKKSLDVRSFGKKMLELKVLLIKSDPSGAKIYIDGEPFVGKETNTVMLIGIGRYKVKVRKGNAEAEESCEVKKDEEVTEVNLKLK